VRGRAVRTGGPPAFSDEEPTIVIDPSAESNDARSLLRLLVEADEHGCELVRHGRFLGLQGPLSKLPPHLWDAIDQHEEALRRRLLNRLTPYRQRRKGAA
jgi:hypothetical protein